MESVTGEQFPEADPEMMNEIDKDIKGKEFHVALKDGVYLLKLIKSLNPDTNIVKRIPSVPPSHKRPFQQRDLIQHFLDACIEYGVPRDNLFETEDLHSAVNMNMVMNTFISLGSTAQKNGYDGPAFGPKISDKNIREFDEETLREGKLVIGLQMGSNMGATQSGMTPYGLSRQIYDPKL